MHLSGKKQRKGLSYGDKDITKFFITNLPNGCTPWEVADFMGGFGEVVGSYIARKRDKDGNRFGFISFKKVKYVCEMEQRLNGIKMGSYKLRVNLAKFAVENKGILGQHEQVKKNVVQLERDMKKTENKQQEVNLQNSSVDSVPVKIWDGISFKETLEGRAKVDMAGESSIVGLKNSELVVEVPDEISAFKELHGKALVGKTVDLKTMTTLHKLLSEDGWAGLEIQYIGGLSVLLKFQDVSEATNFVLLREVWSRWFSVLDVWEGQVLPYEWVAWLRIYGVPLHLAENEVFDSVAGKFGKLIHPAQLKVDDGDLSVVSVGILVEDGVRINEAVRIKWKDKAFMTWVSEEPGDREAECVGLVVAPSWGTPKSEEVVGAHVAVEHAEPIQRSVLDDVQNKDFNELLMGENLYVQHEKSGNIDTVDNLNDHSLQQDYISEGVQSINNNIPFNGDHLNVPAVEVYEATNKANVGKCVESSKMADAVGKRQDNGLESKLAGPVQIDESEANKKREVYFFCSTRKAGLEDKKMKSGAHLHYSSDAPLENGMSHAHGVHGGQENGTLKAPKKWCRRKRTEGDKVVQVVGNAEGIG